MVDRSPAMCISFLLSSEQEIMEQDLLAVRRFHAELNHNPRRRATAESVAATKEKRAPKPAETKKRKRSDLDRVYAIKDFVAVDEVSGHVLVQFEEGLECQWLPYMYLRWACPSLVDKDEMVQKVNLLKGKKAIPPHLDALQRPSIVQYHAIRPLQYVPGDGRHRKELLVYQLCGKSKVGVTHLDLVREGYSLAPQKLRALKAFVRAEKQTIQGSGVAVDMKKHDDLFSGGADVEVELAARILNNISASGSL